MHVTFTDGLFIKCFGLTETITQITLYTSLTITSISMALFQVNSEFSSSTYSGRNLMGSFAGQMPTAENLYTTHSDLIISLAFSNSKPNFNCLTF